MKKLMMLVMMTVGVLMAGCQMGQPVNEALAEDAHDQIYTISDDNDMLIDWLDRSLKGDLDWATENGEDVWSDEKASMKLTTGQARLTADELLENSREVNK